MYNKTEITDTFYPFAISKTLFKMINDSGTVIATWIQGRKCRRVSDDAVFFSSIKFIVAKWCNFPELISIVQYITVT